MMLDEDTRNTIIQPDSNDENYEHLKINCRAADKHYQHEDFGERLATIMRSVMTPNEN